MASTHHRERAVDGRTLRPETLMMGHGYDPSLSQGSLKPPVFLTSTFVFTSAQQGKDLFDVTSGRRMPRPGEETGLVYSRFNNPNAEILEERLALWDGAERGAVLSSGMSAITTTLMTFLRPGDTVLHSRPLYGGTETLLRNTLSVFGITPVGFTEGTNPAHVRDAVSEALATGPVGLILVETPANPTGGVVDLRLLTEVADEIGSRTGRRPLVAVDNTLLGPIFQQPLRHGADLALYSLTKYAGGHSDLVAGGVTGSAEHVGAIARTRSAIGTNPDPHTCWMLLRSLETLYVRTERACDNALRVAQFLHGQERITSVDHPAFLATDDPARQVLEQQTTGASSTFSFRIDGGEAEAFAFLDRLAVCKLAVSLGGTETLICHPASTTHSGVPRDLREEIGLTDSLIRISVGIEDADDIIADLAQALTRL
ncbi:cystathionine gamma-synthase family protein [Streptomyces cylindrosporus]|uniref:Cystathionine gamma-synthase family protein n=1 Tax=Streptomyces cylindrosporus TaxID=2927583 RepID=A0ABS9Y8Y3_9ACTN|nr:cystathionine gamma-synthase family protein [Streptomyces cylindrosporus]MCI3273419.1 cystathionine gamma-synthase family protein [Streptomyces cylindrosporus]